MTFEPATVRLAALLRLRRYEARVSQRVLADFAGVNVSVVSRAEREGDAKLSTWDKLFGALGHILEFDTTESCEDIGGLILDETHRRMENRYQGLMSRLGRR